MSKHFIKLFTLTSRLGFFFLFLTHNQTCNRHTCLETSFIVCFVFVYVNKENIDQWVVSFDLLINLYFPYKVTVTVSFYHVCNHSDRGNLFQATLFIITRNVLYYVRILYVFQVNQTVSVV